MTQVLWYKSWEIIKQNIRTNLLDSVFGISFRMELNITDYEKLDSNSQQQFEKDLLLNLKNYKVKQVHLNGKELGGV